MVVQASDSMMVLTKLFTHWLLPDACLLAGPTAGQLEVFFSDLFFVLSKCLNLIRLFLGDDALHK